MKQLRSLSCQRDAVPPQLSHYFPQRNRSCPELFHIMLFLLFFFPPPLEFREEFEKKKGCNKCKKFKLLLFNYLSSLITSGAFVQVCKSRTHLLHKLCNKLVYPGLLRFHWIIILKQNSRRYFWASPSILHSSSSTYLTLPLIHRGCRSSGTSSNLPEAEQDFE